MKPQFHNDLIFNIHKYFVSFFSLSDIFIYIIKHIRIWNSEKIRTHLSIESCSKKPIAMNQSKIKWRMFTHQIGKLSTYAFKYFIFIWWNYCVIQKGFLRKVFFCIWLHCYGVINFNFIWFLMVMEFLFIYYCINNFVQDECVQFFFYKKKSQELKSNWKLTNN